MFQYSARKPELLNLVVGNLSVADISRLHSREGDIDFAYFDNIMNVMRVKGLK